MNWVGGKLHRHAKANANNTRRNQKSYFARARQGNQHSLQHSPLALLHYHAANHGHGPPAPERDTAIPLNQAEPRQQAQLANLSKENTAQTREDPDTLRLVKARLLQTTDWASIGLSRPPPSNFRSRSQMNRIGRRRKITSQEHGYKIQKRRENKRLARQADRMNDAENPQHHLGLQEQDYSIRLGSNIHKSQRTSQRVDSASHERYSNIPTQDLMLVETPEQEQRFTPRAQEPLELRNTEDYHSPAQSQFLPLNKALDLCSFDEVRDRSSSIVRHCPPTSDLFKFSSESPDAHGPSNPLVTNGQADTVASHSAGHEVHMKEADYSHAKPETEHIPDINFPSDALESPFQKESSNRSGPMRRHLQSGSSNDASSHSLLNSRFTIDHQVLMERLAKNQDDRSPTARAEGMQDSHPDRIPGSQPAQLQEARRVIESSQHDAHSRMTTTDEASSGGMEPPRKRPRLATDLRSTTSQGAMSLSDAISGSSPGTAKTQPRHNPNLRQRYTTARAETGDTVVGSSASDPPTAFSISDENEDWLRDVFPRDFPAIRNGFTFSPSASQSLPHMSSPSPTRPQSSMFERIDLPKSPRKVVTTDAVTSLNTVLHKRVSPSLNEPKYSETDFISRYSPMEGVIDDRLGAVSMHNNAARSGRGSCLALSTSHSRTSRTPTPFSPTRLSGGHASSPRLPERQFTPHRTPLWTSTRARVLSKANLPSSSHVSSPQYCRKGAVTPLWNSPGTDVAHRNHDYRLDHNKHYPGFASVRETSHRFLVPMR
jgi:hypothetical protein